MFPSTAADQERADRIAEVQRQVHGSPYATFYGLGYGLEYFRQQELAARGRERLVIAKRPEGGSKRAFDNGKRKDRADHNKQEAEIICAKWSLLVTKPIPETEIAESHQATRATRKRITEISLVEETFHVALYQFLDHNCDRKGQQHHVGAAQAQGRGANDNTCQARQYRAEPGTGPQRYLPIKAQKPNGVSADQKDGHLRQRVNTGHAKHEVPVNYHAAPNEQKRDLAEDVPSRTEHGQGDQRGQDDEADSKVQTQLIAAQAPSLDLTGRPVKRNSR